MLTGFDEVISHLYGHNYLQIKMHIKHNSTSYLAAALIEPTCIRTTTSHQSIGDFRMHYQLDQRFRKHLLANQTDSKFNSRA